METNKIAVFDIETMKNDARLGFEIENEIKKFTNESNRESLKTYLSKISFLAGYNSASFDNQILQAYLKGFSDIEIYLLSQLIIKEKYTENYIIPYLLKNQEITQEQIKKVKKAKKRDFYLFPNVRCIDIMRLIGPKPGSMRQYGRPYYFSMKSQGTKIDFPKLQSLPFSPDKTLTQEEKQKNDLYLDNDLALTRALLNHQKKEIEIRLQLEKDYNLGDLLNCSKSSVGSKFLLTEYSRITGINVNQISKLKENLTYNLKLSNLVHPKIKFISDKLNQELEELKTKEIVEKAEDDFSFDFLIGNKIRTVKKGGFHSSDDSKIIEVDNDYVLVDNDVTSFYLYIIINMFLFPKHLSKTFTEIVKSITEKRVSYKKEGKKLEAASLKIIALSIFGLLKANHSPIFCPETFYRITINGQILILKYVELLELANIEIVSVNTDGVLVKIKKDRLKELEQINASWMQETNFNLEQGFYKKYICWNVNKYILIPEDEKKEVKIKGDITTKQDITKAKKLKIVPKAIYNYFVNNIIPETTISQETDIRMFLEAYEQAGYEYKLVLFQDKKENELEKVIRYYHSTENNILCRKRVALRKGKQGKIGSTTEIDRNIGIMMDIVEGTEKVNKAYYIQKCYEEIYKVENPAKVAKLSKQLNLFFIPKDKKKNPKGSKLGQIKTKYNFGEMSGFGVMTGQEAGIGVIDLDNLYKCNNNYIFPLLKETIFSILEETAFIYHGKETTFDEIKQGKRKAALVYRCNSLYIKESLPSFSSKFGFEFLYKKPAQCSGFHDSNEEYKLVGNPQPIPIKLLEFLINTCSSKYKPKILRKYEVEEGYKKCQISNDSEIAEIERRIKELGLSHKYNKKKKFFVGFCPGQSEHGKSAVDQYGNYLKPIGQGQKTDSAIMKVERNSEIKLFVQCFHPDCLDIRRNISKLLSKTALTFKTNTKQEELESIKISLEDRKTVSKLSHAYFNIDNNVLITAPPGAGKTFFAAKFCIEKAIKGKEKVIYTASNKLDQDFFVQKIKALTNLEELPFTQVIKLNEDEIEEKSKTELIKKETKLIITHHSYLMRKYLTNVYPGLMKHLDDSILIIDECDEWIKKQHLLIKIGARYRIIKHKNAPEKFFMYNDICPKKGGFGNCENCHYRQFQNYTVTVYNTGQIITEKKVFESKEKYQTKLDLPKIELSGKYIVGNLKISPISQHENYKKNKEFRFCSTDNEVYDFKEILADLINSAHCPCIYTPIPTLNKKEILPENITAKNKNKVKFPNQTCSPVISLKDPSALQFIKKNCKRVIFTTASMLENPVFKTSNRDFLLSVFPDIKHAKIEETDINLDQTLIIGFAKKIKFVGKKKGKMINSFSFFPENERILAFQQRKNAAINLFEKVPNNFPASLLIEGIDKCYSKFIHNEKKLLISYQGSNFYRGINFGEFGFNTVICDMSMYKPKISFNAEKYENKEFFYMQETDKIETVIQCVGRVLRGSGRKLIIVYNATEVDVEFIANHNKILSDNINTQFFNSDQEALFHCAINYLKTGEIVNLEKTALEKAKESNLAAVSPNQREEIREEYNDFKDKGNFVLLIKRLENHKGCWSDFYRKNSLARLEKEKLERLRKIFAQKKEKERIENEEIKLESDKEIIKNLIENYNWSEISKKIKYANYLPDNKLKLRKFYKREITKIERE